MTQEKIPVYGSMIRPDHPIEAKEEMRKGLITWAGGPISITFTTDEFTSVCPSTGQPDFNKITITYVPNKYYIESKTLKFYLWSFRDYGVHCEYLADMLCKDIKEITKAKSVKVVVEQKPRGGIGLISTCEL